MTDGIPISRPVLVDFIRYVIGGGIATLIHLAILAVLVEHFGVNPTLGTSVGFCVGTAFNYAFQYYFTFRARGPHVRMFTRYLVVTLIMLGVNVLLFNGLTTELQIPYIYAQLLATGVVMLSNFAINRFYTFKST